ncbi:MAG: cupin domain-containing protein, partial [Sedimentisphaerales bacterium]|nr:cupin domain-containing protein [Sedimentisphaerales bacterium]
DGETPITVGDVVLVPPGEKHRFRNASATESAKMLCIVPVEYQK